MNFGQELKWSPGLMMETHRYSVIHSQGGRSQLMRCYHNHIMIQKNQLSPSVGGEVAGSGSLELLAISLEEIL